MKKIEVSTELYQKLDKLSAALGFESVDLFIAELLGEIPNMINKTEDLDEQEFLQEKLESLGYL